MALDKNVEQDIVKKKKGIFSFLKKNTKKLSTGVKNDIIEYTNINEIKEYNKDFIENVMSNINQSTSSNKPVESFNAAVKRKHLTEDNIKQSFVYYRFLFFVGVVLCVAAILFACYTIYRNGSLFVLAPTFACCALGISEIIIGSFRSFQINHRELYSFKKWLLNKGYIPIHFIKKNELDEAKALVKKKSFKKFLEK